MQIPHPIWKSAKYKIGQKVRFVNSTKPLDIRIATVTGWDCQDRILADYQLTPGVIAIGASIHVNTILPAFKS